MAPPTINKMVARKKNGDEPIISRIRTTDAYVELQTINFLLTREIGPNGSVNQGEPIPWELQLYATLGGVRADTEWDDGGGTIPDGIVNDSVYVVQLIFNGMSTSVQLDRGWRFGTNPLKATWADSARSEAGQATVRLEVIVEHTPDAAP